MDSFIIEGDARLQGEILISGSKNASLPLMAAALLTDEEVILEDIPDLRDIRNMMGLLRELGCEITLDDDGPCRIMHLRTTSQANSHARYEIVRTMRASICVLGPLLAKRGLAKVSMPGGCAIGERPIDLHLRGLQSLGAKIHLEAGDITADAETLQGVTIFLGGPFGSTVLGTANVMSAAVLAHGVTVIESAACEPEIVELANLLNAMGGQVRGAGTPRIVIEGVSSLHGARYRVMPDRIEAGTYMIAAAMTKSNLILRNCPVDCLLSLEDRLQAAGVRTVHHDEPGATSRSSVEVLGASVDVILPVQVTTQPFPGFPTDLQAQLLAMLCLADGISVVTEKIYPERFLHVAELSRMGAHLYRQGPTVVVEGGPSLVGAPVMASDLRASAGLVLAGLAASGTTIVNRVYHLDRGYEKMEEKLNAAGANIKRVAETDLV